MKALVVTLDLTDVAYVFAQHVVTDALENLDIIDHSLQGRRCIDTIGPETLIQGTELEEEFTIEQWTLNIVNHATRNRPKAGIALDGFTAKFDRDVVQRGRIR